MANGLRAIGEVLREVREEHGLSQRRCAELLGVSTSAMSDRETGVARVQPEDLVRLEDALGVVRGEVLRRAGYVRDPAGPLEVIDSWTWLGAPWRRGYPTSRRAGATGPVPGGLTSTTGLAWRAPGASPARSTGRRTRS